MLYARRYYNKVRRRKETSERADNMRAATPVWENGRKVQLQVVKLLYNCTGKCAAPRRWCRAQEMIVLPSSQNL